MQKRRRKQRRVYGAYTEIDNVTIKPGVSYQNWIKLSKEKLKERELKLTEVRMMCVKKAITNSINGFNSNQINIQIKTIINEKCLQDIQKIVINNEIKSICMYYIDIELRRWNGINLNRSNKVFGTFRKYFIPSKNWFDERKKEVLAEYLWVKIFSFAKQFCDNVSIKYVSNLLPQNQSQFSQLLLLKILYSLFTSKTHFVSTKPQPLIPGGTIRDTKMITNYLTNQIHNSLNVNRLIQDKNKKGDISQIKANDTLQFIIKNLNKLIIIAEGAFQNIYFSSKLKYDSLSAHSVASASSIDTILSNSFNCNYTPNNPFSSSLTNNFNNKTKLNTKNIDIVDTNNATMICYPLTNYFTKPLSERYNNNNNMYTKQSTINASCCNGYNPIHCAAFKSSDTRYNPMNRAIKCTQCYHCTSQYINQKYNQCCVYKCCLRTCSKCC